MVTRELGRSGLEVSALGLECRGMSEFYGESDEGESIATIHRALRDRRDEVTLAAKLGIVRDPVDASIRQIGGKSDYVRSACAEAMRAVDG